MIRKGIALILCIGIVLLSACASETYDATDSYERVTIEPTATKVTEIKMSDITLKQCTEAVEKSDSWCLGMPIVNVDYLPNFMVTSYVLPHNGDDNDRLVTISCIKSDESYYDSTHKETYAPTIENFRKSWVSISEMEVRMIPMETKAIPISLFIPKDVDITEKYWSFIINAVGQDIIKETESVVINTVDDDTTLELKIANRLFKGDLSSVNVQSDLPEDNIKLVRYDDDKMILYFTGLKENSTRTITLSYERTNMVNIAYNQLWLINMSGL
jgi:hypothetical protein